MFNTGFLRRGVSSATTKIAFAGVLTLAFAVACGGSDTKPADAGTDASPDGSRGGSGGSVTGGSGGKGGSGGATGGSGGLGGGVAGSAGGGGSGGAAGAGAKGGNGTGGSGGATGGGGGANTTGGSSGGSAGVGQTGGKGGGAGQIATGGGGSGGTGVGGAATGGVATGGTGQAGAGQGGAGTGGAPTPAHVTGWIETLDFGLNPCGAAQAPAAKTFTLTNSGGTAAKITAASIAGAAGYSTDAVDKTIPANGTLVVTIQPPAIPQISATPGNYNATVTFQTNISGDTSHAVSVTMGALGAILKFEAAESFGSFGAVPAGSTARQTFRISNEGNADVTLTASATAPYVVDATNIVVMKGQSVDGGVTFDASTPQGLPAGSHTGTLSFASGTAVCGAQLASTSLTATTINGGIQLSRNALTVYPVCGDPTPAGDTFTVTNIGNAPITFTTSLRFNTFSVSPAVGTPVVLPAPDSQNPGANTTTVTVTPPPIGAPVIFGDAVTIETMGIAGDSPHTVNLGGIAIGDAISVSTPGGVDFGQVPIITPAKTGSLQLVFRNDALVAPSASPAHITLTNDNPSLFSLDATSLSIPPQQSQTVTVTFAPGTDKSILGGYPSLGFAAHIGWSIGADQNCNGSAGASGQVSFTATATAATVVVSASSLVFGTNGLVNCGEQGQPMELTLSNPGANSYTISNVQLGGGGFFSYSLSGTEVAPSSSQKFTITPLPIPPAVPLVPNGTAAKPNGAFNGSLSFTTDAPNDSPHVIPLYMGAKGVIISGAPPAQSTYLFKDVAVGGQSFFNLSVVNSGNATAQATFASQNLAAVFGIVPTPTIIATGAQNGSGDFVAKSTPINMYYRPTTPSATDNDLAFITLAPTAGNVFCEPLPVAWDNLSKNGVAVQGSSLAGNN